MSKVSVIMRTFNCADTVGQALATLSRQAFTDWDLIVVDSGSTDGTLAIVRQYACTLIEIPSSDYIPGRVLNRAIAASRSELIVFQNSDVILCDPGCLQRLVDVMDQHPRCAAAYGRQLARPEAESWVQRDYEASFPASGPGADWITLSLPIAIMRHSVWAQRPFYDFSWGSEDTEWGAWARSAGHPVLYVPAVTAIHSHNYTLRQLYGRRYIEGEADCFIYGSTLTPLRAFSQYARAVAQDWLWMAHRGYWRDMVTAPVRRAVFWYAYWLGQQWGQQRKRDNNLDIRHGQTTVMKRYAKVS